MARGCDKALWGFWWAQARTVRDSKHELLPACHSTPPGGTQTASAYRVARKSAYAQLPRNAVPFTLPTEWHAHRAHSTPPSGTQTARSARCAYTYAMRLPKNIPVWAFECAIATLRPHMGRVLRRGEGRARPPLPRVARDDPLRCGGACPFRHLLETPSQLPGRQSRACRRHDRRTRRRNTSFRTWGSGNDSRAQYPFLTTTYCVMVPFSNWALLRVGPARTTSRPPSPSSWAWAFSRSATSGADLSPSLSSGDALTLVSACFFALNIVAVGRYAAAHDYAVITIVMICRELTYLRRLRARGGTPLPDLAAMPADFWWQMSYVALLSTALATLLQNLAQRHVRALRRHCSSRSGSVFAVFAFSVLLYGERLTLHSQ